MAKNQMKDEPGLIIIDDPLIYYDISWSQRNRTPMIRMKIHEQYKMIHEHYIYLEHSGNARAMAIRFLMNLLKDKDNFYELSRAGELNCENMVKLLEHHYDDFFIKIKRVELKKTDKNKKELHRLVFNQE